MYGILISALAGLGQWLLRAVVLKAAAFGILFAVVSEFVPLIVSELLPNPSSITSSINQLDDAFFFYADIFMLFQGLSIILGAYACRFIIRRIPLIG